MEEKYPALEDEKVALIGAANGILMYDLFYPYVVLILFQLILGSRYSTLIETNSSLLSISFMIISSLLTLAVGIFIAKPKNLLKVINKYKKSDIKLIFKTLGCMLLFTFGYNVFISIMGVDASGGNANQSNVLELVYSTPVLSFFSMIIVAPMLEELTYRYFIYGGIAKHSRKWAIILSGFIFMCVHATASFTQDVNSIFRELLLLPPYMFSGMALAYSYDKSSNIVIPITIHALNNLISFILCFL